MRFLKIESLPTAKTWLDRDMIMVHACFQILQDFIDKEKGDTNCDYKSQKNDIDEIRFLYSWWQTRKFNNVNANDNEDSKMLIRLMKVRHFLWT